MIMTKILDGKKVKKDKLIKLKEKVFNERICLAIIQVGDNPASNVYVRNKKKLAKSLGYEVKHYKFDENVCPIEIEWTIEELNADDSVDGIFIQLPIPKRLNVDYFINLISPEKDIDGLTDINAGKMVRNKPCLESCTPAGIIDMLNYYNVPMAGKNVVIVGRSDLVGKPLASMMINNDATVTLAHSKTENLQEITKTADILVVAVGKPKLITKEYIKEDAAVIDVGINQTENGIVGDVDFDDVYDTCSAITPVPGGVGQMTVYEVCNNTYKAHKLRRK